MEDNLENINFNRLSVRQEELLFLEKFTAGLTVNPTSGEIFGLMILDVEDIDGNTKMLHVVFSPNDIDTLIYTLKNWSEGHGQ